MDRKDKLWQLAAVEINRQAIFYFCNFYRVLNAVGSMYEYNNQEPKKVPKAPLTFEKIGDRYSLSKQVINLESTPNNEVWRMTSGNSLRLYLAKSMVLLAFGSNGYIKNYLLPSIYSAYTYTPTQFAKLLLNHYTRHSLRFCKFLVAGLGPLGCIPNQRASGRAPPGRCADYVNNMLGSFNEGLKCQVELLNRNHVGTEAMFSNGNTYGAFGDILNNPAAYGFKVIDTACCGIGRNQGQITCMPFQVSCENRKDYLLWDVFHPTEAANAVLAWRAYVGHHLIVIQSINLESLVQQCHK